MNNTKSTKRTLVTSILSLVLCMAMLVGTTFAWFTDNVTSTGNIIKSGTLKVQMDWAEGDEDPETATWKDASTGAIFNSELWEPGYTEAKHVKVSNVGTLALRYQMRILANGVVSELADVIDVYYLEEAEQLSRANVATKGEKLGTLSEVLNNTKATAISNTVKGSLEAGKSNTVTIALKMQESAGNEYQNLSIGTDFSIQLLATQDDVESDTFDNTYDAGAEFAAQEKPSAMVSKLTGDELDINYILGLNGPASSMKLDAGFQFEPTETYEQALASVYADAHADFFVYADKDVEAGSLAVAGYYDAWCSLVNHNWVAFESPDVAAGKDNAIRLIADGMNGGSTNGGITVPYNAICQLGNDGIGFRCGLADLSDDGSNAGTTITVELRLYQTYPMGQCPPEHGGHSSANCETGEYITVGTFSYTFGAWEVDSQEDLNTAINNGVTDIELADGNYTITGVNLRDKTLNISGNKGAVVDLSNVDGRNQFVTGANLKFDGVTLEFTKVTNDHQYYGLANTAKLVYENCDINGQQCLYGNTEFINCNLSATTTEHCLWTYGADEIRFTDCKFTYSDRAVNCFSDQADQYTKAYFTNCTFIKVAGVETTGAIETNSSIMSGLELTITNCSVNEGDLWWVAKWDSLGGEKTIVNGVSAKN